MRTFCSQRSDSADLDSLQCDRRKAEKGSAHMVTEMFLRQLKGVKHRGDWECHDCVVALKSMGVFGREALVPHVAILRQHLKNENVFTLYNLCNPFEHRALVAVCLEHIGEKGHVDALLKKKDSDARRLTIQSLEDLGEAAADQVGAVISLLKDPRRMRTWSIAARALFFIGGSRRSHSTLIAKTLQANFKELSSSAQVELVDVIAQMCKRRLCTIYEHLRFMLLIGLRLHAPMSSTSWPAIVQFVLPVERAEYRGKTGWRWHRSVDLFFLEAGVLARMLSSRDWQVRWAAVNAFGSIGSASADHRDMLRDMVGAGTKEVSEAALAALSSIADGYKL